MISVEKVVAWATAKENTEKSLLIMCSSADRRELLYGKLQEAIPLKDKSTLTPQFRIVTCNGSMIVLAVSDCCLRGKRFDSFLFEDEAISSEVKLEVYARVRPCCK